MGSLKIKSFLIWVIKNQIFLHFHENLSKKRHGFLKFTTKVGKNVEILATRIKI